MQDASTSHHPIAVGQPAGRLGAPAGPERAAIAADAWLRGADGGFPDSADAVTTGPIRVDSLDRLQQALREVDTLRRRLRAAEAALDHLDCAVFVLDARAAIHQANRGARRLLAEGDGLGRCGQTLCARVNGDAAALRAFVARAAAQGCGPRPNVLRIRRGADRPPLIATAPAGVDCVGPCRQDEQVVLLFVADPARRRDVAADLLRDAFGLTDREVSVALALLRCSGLPAAAAQLRIAPTTARSHLQHVFDKTGTRNQVALAQMLASLGALPDTTAADGGGTPAVDPGCA